MDFEKPKRLLNHFNVLSKQLKLALVPPSKYTKTLLCNHLSIQKKTVAVSQNVFAGSKVKSLKNPWRSIL